MSASGSRPPEASIRQQVGGDAPAVHNLVTAAFGDRLVADLDDALGRRKGGAAYVAESAQGLLGHVRLTRGWLDAPTRLVEVLVLGPLSVAPDWQRCGLGRALVAHAISASTDLGAPLLFLEGDPTYYSASGFEAAGRLGFTRPSVRIPEPAFQVRRLAGYEPWMTGALVYSDTFWQFDCVGLREASED